MAGYNIRANIWRLDYSGGDDVVGGADPTGTIVLWNVLSRFQQNEPTQVFLEQGIEANRVYEAMVIPGTLDIRDNDEYQISKPNDHPFHNERFRIVGVQYSSHTPRDPRNFLKLYLHKIVRSRAVAK